MRRSHTPALAAWPRGIALLTLALGLPATGCSARRAPAPRTATPSAARPIASETHDAAPSPQSSAEVELFGDDAPLLGPPFAEPKPPDLAQHTFTVDGRDFDPDVTVDGRALAFASTRDALHPDIYLRRDDPRGPIRVASHPADDVQPRFSPDGKSIAFASNRSGNWDIWIMARDAPEPVPLTHDRGDQIAPAWAPDGLHVAYTYWNPRSRQWEVWCQRVDGPGVPVFVAVGMFPAWSPDGRRVAFQRARDRGRRLFSLWTIEFDGETPGAPVEVVAQDDAAAVAPAWSPAGDELAYCRVTRAARGGWSDDRRTQLRIVNLQTGAQRVVMDAATRAANPAWCATGRIYFVSDAAGTENIWSIGVSACAGDETPTPAPPESSGPPVADVVAAHAERVLPARTGGSR